MNQADASDGHLPITLQQKQTLIAVYERTGNMSQAMREASILSPKTAYLWWRRYCESGEAGLQPRSHARHTQERLPDETVERIRDLRRAEPGWGRRRIANALAQRYDEHVSPAAIELTLRRAGLWNQSAQIPSGDPPAVAPPDWLRHGVDYDGLLATVQEGVHLSLQSIVQAANDILYQQVWHPLENNPRLLNQALATTRNHLDNWLLASRLALGHSLMNSGNWPQSARILRETLEWMAARPADLRQRTDEDASAAVSLRRDDIWLGSMHHLALMLAKQNQVEVGIGFLQTALIALRRNHRPVLPTDIAESGNLHRDLAHLKLRLRNVSSAQIHQHLLEAQHSAEEAGSLGAQAFTHFAWAKLYDHQARATSDRENSARRQYRDEMERAIHRALAVVESAPDDRPMRLTLCYVDAAQLFLTHGMPVAEQWVQDAAHYCIHYGYGGQAQHLLNIPGVHLLLSTDDLRHLAQVAR